MSAVDQISCKKNTFALIKLKITLSDAVKYKFESCCVLLSQTTI